MHMKPYPDKINDVVLALWHLTSFTEGRGELAATRAWKGHDWAALDGLHREGLISDPRNKSKSVAPTNTERRRAEGLFHQPFWD